MALLFCLYVKVQSVKKSIVIMGKECASVERFVNDVFSRIIIQYSQYVASLGVHNLPCVSSVSVKWNLLPTQSPVLL